MRFSSTCQSLAKLLHDYLAEKTKESELVQRRSCQFRFRSRGSSLEKPNFFLEQEAAVDRLEEFLKCSSEHRVSRALRG